MRTPSSRCRSSFSTRKVAMFSSSSPCSFTTFSIPMLTVRILLARRRPFHTRYCPYHMSSGSSASPPLASSSSPSSLTPQRDGVLAASYRIDCRKCGVVSHVGDQAGLLSAAAAQSTGGTSSGSCRCPLSCWSLVAPFSEEAGPGRQRASRVDWGAAQHRAGGQRRPGDFVGSVAPRPPRATSDGGDLRARGRTDERPAPSITRHVRHLAGRARLCRRPPGYPVPRGGERVTLRSLSRHAHHVSITPSHT